jgi:hypothetical protein
MGLSCQVVFLVCSRFFVRSARSAAPGNAKILRGSWNDDLFRVLEGFPELAQSTPVAEPWRCSIQHEQLGHL